MATIAQILDKRWPGREWTLIGDDYDSLVWGHLEDGQVVNPNPEGKPTLAAIQAFSGDVDLEVATDLRDEAREAELAGLSPGQLFKILDAIVAYMAALHSALPSNVRNQVPAGAASNMQAVRTRLNEILARHP